MLPNAAQSMAPRVDGSSLKQRRNSSIRPRRQSLDSPSIMGACRLCPSRSDFPRARRPTREHGAGKPRGGGVTMYSLPHRSHLTLTSCSDTAIDDSDSVQLALRKASMAALAHNHSHSPSEDRAAHERGQGEAPYRYTDYYGRAVTGRHIGFAHSPTPRGAVA